MEKEKYIDTINFFEFKILTMNTYIIENKNNLLDFNRYKMRELLSSIGENAFRADQIMKWVYQRHFDTFDQMTNINKRLQKKLKTIIEIKAPEIVEEKISIDGTIKWMMSVGNQLIDTVYIPEKKRSTICISSQVGCALGCKFCATSYQGFNRNLKVSEIVGQIWNAIKSIKNKSNIIKKTISHVVIMGMGEPLLNFDNIVNAIKIISDDFGFGLSKKRITLSTSGIVPALNKLSNTINVSLAISLHASNDKIRDNIMPINKKYNINNVLHAAKNYIKAFKDNKKKFTIEYVMLNNINDSNDNAYELSRLLKNMPCKINLIPWNSFPEALYSCSPISRIFTFSKILINNGFITTIRKNRGNDINAACGQLTGLVLNRKKNNYYYSNKTVYNKY